MLFYHIVVDNIQNVATILQFYPVVKL